MDSHHRVCGKCQLVSKTMEHMKMLANEPRNQWGIDALATDPVDTNRVYLAAGMVSVFECVALQLAIYILRGTL